MGCNHKAFLYLTFARAKVQFFFDICKKIPYKNAELHYFVKKRQSETVFVLVAVDEGKAVFAEAVEADEEHNHQNT